MQYGFYRWSCLEATGNLTVLWHDILFIRCDSFCSVK